jgi:hypothetical protein
MFDLVVLGAPTVLRWRGQRVDLRPMQRVVILALVCGRCFHTGGAVKLLADWRDPGWASMGAAAGRGAL